MHDHVRPLTLHELSESQGISLSYLEQLFSRLRESNLVEGVRGPGGGYRLVRKPSEVTVAEIITAVEGPDEDKTAPVSSESDIFWDELSHQLYDFLDQMTLAQFVPKPDVSQFVKQQTEEMRKLNFILPRPISPA